ncbi:transglutaminase [Tsuneonella deserti]|uniref:Transglutaminase n=1 Tax=Tsuneonella deserti TaxID=2035528 RepID=A0ABQ1S213_9SPHN|nr:transglutaminase family protein [Tsuneonella deserti]GGD90193.1 transglutaminase [Tsuneonella deserti]
MRLAIRHATRYTFDQPVVHALQRLRLTPKATQGQVVLDWSMRLEGAREELQYEDQHHNHVTLISVEPGVEEVVITCEGTVETRDHAGVIGYHSGHLPLWSFVGQTDLTRPGSRLRHLLRGLEAPDRSRLEYLHALSAAIREQVAYGTGATGANTTAEQSLEAGCGVCQDHAHIFIGAARLTGIPARYVSGYLMMNDRIDQEATHAWAEAHVDGLGWVGFDVSNGISPDPRYVRLATGRDYRDAAPVTGISYGGAREELHVEVAVEQQQQEQ